MKHHFSLAFTLNVKDKQENKQDKKKSLSQGNVLKLFFYLSSILEKWEAQAVIILSYTALIISGMGYM